MKTNTKILVIILIIIFFIGLYATMYFNNPYKSENMTNVTSRCPNMLVKKEMFSCNTIPVSQSARQIPCLFFNLDEYINYLEIQKQNGNTCPFFSYKKKTTHKQ